MPTTMDVVQEYLVEKQSSLSGHRLFTLLNREDLTLDQAMAFVPSVAFWVFSFQDMIRINYDRVVDPKMAPLVQHHLDEDRGHDKWYLFDCKQLGYEIPSVDAVFGRVGQETRLASYEMMTEILNLTDDRMRVIILLTMEAAGHVFFGGVSETVHRLGGSERLKYLSRFHLDVEQNHAMFAEDGDVDDIGNLELSPALQKECFALADRVFAIVYRMLTDLADAVEARLQPS